MQKEKKCRNKKCSKPFIPTRFCQVVCSPTCAIEYGKQQKEAKLAQERAKMKEAIKTPSDYRKGLEHEINHIVRLIDKGLGCIGCLNSKRMAAGHFHAVGSNHSLRFHLDNIHRQDFHCNGNGGQLLKYGAGLIREYGKEYKEYVEYELIKLYPEIKLSVVDLKDKIKVARSIVKYLELENKTYGSKERLELRKKFNNMIGIYN